MSFFNGEFTTRGGVGMQGEAGAAGTVYIKDVRQATKTLMIYNQKGAGVSRTGLVFRLNIIVR